MSAHADLVTRLRSYRPHNEWGDEVHHVIADEAADAIAELTARNDALSAELEAINAQVVSIQHLKSFDQLFEQQKEPDHG